MTRSLVQTQVEDLFFGSSAVEHEFVITIHYVLLSVNHLNFRNPQSRVTPPFTLTVISTLSLKSLHLFYKGDNMRQWFKKEIPFTNADSLLLIFAHVLITGIFFILTYS